MKQSKSIRVKILICAVFLLLLAQAFNGSLSISSFEKLYLNTLISSYQVLGRDLQRSIQSAVRFGKPLDKFLGINTLFQQLKADSPDLDNVVVALPDGRILYSLDAEKVGGSLPDPLKIDFSPQEGKDTRDEVREGILAEQSYHTLLPIFNRAGDWLGTIDISFKQDLIQEKIKTIFNKNLIMLGASTLIAAVLLGIALSFFVSFQQERIQKVRLYIILILVLGGAQAYYSVFNVNFFKNNYIDIIRTKTQTLTQLLQEDIEYLLSKGIRIDRLIKVDALMSEIIQATPELDNMRIVTASDEMLYLATSEGVIDLRKQESAQGISTLDFTTDGIYDIEVPLRKKENVEGFIKVQISRAVIGDKIKEIILDSVTVGVIALLFVLELLYFMILFIKKQLDRPAKPGEEQPFEAYTVIRPVAFIYIFAVDLSISFLPLHMGNLYQPLFGLSKDIVMGLPISAEMLFAGIALLIAGTWMDKKGWHQPFLVGVVLTAVGACLSGLATDALTFILFRGVTGLGYGLTWMSAQGFVFSCTTMETRARGISSLVAGIYAGSICGGSAGAMLAERMGYAPVFVVAMGIALLTIPFVLLLMRDYFKKPEALAAEREKKEKFNYKMFFRFLFNRNIFSLLFFSSLPAGLTLVGFLNYASPIYLNRIGTSQSNIGRALMVYGLFMIFLSPAISRVVDKSANKKIFIAFSGILGGAGMAYFHLFSGLFATVMAILMLSLASSFGFASQSVFALNLKITQEVGTGQAMGIYRAVERLGQVLGPIIVGTVLAFTRIEDGITYLGLGYILLTGLFVLGATDEKKAETAAVTTS